MADKLVNVDNFTRIESDRMFAAMAHDAGGVNRWLHFLQPTPLEHQPIIRLNRDTLYSAIVVDASAGFRLTLPDAAGRYMSAMVVDQDHFLPAVWHDSGTHTLTRDEAGTDHVLIGVRTLVDPADADDVAIVNTLQQQLRIETPAATPFEPAAVDEASYVATREALLELSRGLPDFSGAFGRREDVDPVHHLLGTASGWGGLPQSEAFYVNVEPGLPVGDYELTVGDVPVDAFWSVSVYNAAGYFEPNDSGVNNVNSVTAQRNPDGTTTVGFGNGDAPNTIPITEGWNYLVRLYRPHAEVLSGAWTFPAARPAQPSNT